MPVIEMFGATLETYGADESGMGWVRGTFKPTSLACNPRMVVQAGVLATLEDACMNFAINAALSGKSVPRATLELKVEAMRPVLLDLTYGLYGRVTRLAKQVAFAESEVSDLDGALMSRATGTFLLHRAEASPRPALSAHD